MGLVIRLFLTAIAVLMILSGFADAGVTFLPGVLLLVATWGLKIKL